ncbi:zona pellucida sperm-binding protein 4-like [Salminus brasiliensis]|uniref:zona pellucida sperm-binding protein 4-like n=1 Tax=Salminus brasiliensis TaxID=930266 RepID=UPI003B832995
MGEMWGAIVVVVFGLNGLSNAAVASWSLQAEKQPGPFPPQQPGPLAPQQPRPLPPQQPGPLAPQQPRPLPPQLPGPLAPQQPRPLPPQLPGPLAPQQPRPLPPQLPGPLAPQQSRPLPQLPGPPAPQLPGPPAPQLPGPPAPQLLGPLAPQQPRPLPPQLPGSPAPQQPRPLPPKLPGPLAPQQPRPLPPQLPGPLPPQQPRPLPPQLPGPPAPQQPRPVPPQLPGPLAPQLPGPLAPQQPRPLPPQLPGLFAPPRYDPQPQVTTFDKCRLADADKIPCGEPGIDASQCAAINCCFDGQQCYYGKAVTVQCTIDGQFVLVVARDTTLPRLSLDSISLLGGSDGPCGVVDYNADFAIYQFPVTACGTRAMVLGDYVVYENKMSSSYEVGVGPLGAITRDSHFELYFQCRYSTTTVVSLAVELSSNDPPLPVAASGPLRVELRLGNGQCVTKGCVEEQVAYTSYYTAADYPVTKVLREPVYVEVRMLERTDPNLVLVLDHCWATSTPDPVSVPQWDLLVNGCPYRDDHYLTTLVPVDGSSGLPYPSHYKRFVFKMFTFVDPASMAPLKERVFIHCSTAVCSLTAGATCEPRCNRRRRDTGAAIRNSHPVSVVSSGEVIYTQTVPPQLE